jgi:hypothetical protein
MTDVTLLLKTLEPGDPHAAAELLQLIYDDLRRLAAHRLAQEGAGQTLEPTALVHEAYLRLVGDALGNATLAFNNMSGIGRGGTGVLKVDGKEVATQKMEHTIPLILQWDKTFDVGADTGTPVDDKDYQVPFRFTGKLNKLTVKLDRPKLTPRRLPRRPG